MVGITRSKVIFSFSVLFNMFTELLPDDFNIAYRALKANQISNSQDKATLTSKGNSEHGA